MTCVNCQNRIEKQLKNTPGVENAEVSFAAGNAAVSYDPEITTFDTIREEIAASPPGRARGSSKMPMN